MNPVGAFLDPLGIMSSFSKVHEAWMRNPAELTATLTQMSSDFMSLNTEELIPFLFDGKNAKETPEDLRNAFLTLVNNYAVLMQKYHAACGGWLKDYVSRAEEIEDRDRERSMFMVDQIMNALAPSNCFWTNPVAVRKFMLTKGESLINGFNNWRRDVERGDNLVSIADTTAFKVGDNLATTPGVVVFRNELMELIQYTPATDTTYAVPVVFIQPWINKYYIFDLDKGKSLVRYLRDQGFTVFVVSWKNPTSAMHAVNFEDYMFLGALKAIEVAREICAAEHVHAVGYCIGGTVLAALMAWLNEGAARGDSLPVRHWTLFAGMVDFSEPGGVGVYISEDSVEKIEEVMERDGYLDGKHISLAFRLLRSDSLIWRYFVHNYLQGEMPPKSDFLYWNSDSTRLPAAMTSFFLREFCLHNKLTKRDGVVLGNRPMDLERIDQPLYAVGAEQDHLCPWKTTFKICNLVKAPVRYTLAAEGHIIGFVNPPSPRNNKKYWTGEAGGQSDPDRWLSGQQEQRGSWWEDWVRWLSRRCGSLGAPPAESAKYPPLAKAPGSYVMEQ